MGIPPVDAGAVNDTVTELVDVLVTDVIVGALSGVGFITILFVAPETPDTVGFIVTPGPILIVIT
jgi:hypothetical protein